MSRQVLAFDFDGTLAETGSVQPALQKGLHQLRAAGPDHDGLATKHRAFLSQVFWRPGCAGCQQSKGTIR
jgi:hypothetical protein